MKFGERKTIGEERYYYSKIPTLDALYYYIIKKKKLIHWWCGTDALTLVMYPPGDKQWYIRIFLRRIKTRLLDRIITQHLCESEKLKEKLIRFGIAPKKIEIRHTTLYYPQKVKRQPLVLAYYPLVKKNQKYKDWVYGADIIRKLQELETGVNWLVVHGSIDLNAILPVLDAYVRPNRHDGMPRLVRECQLNHIPYYWSEDGQPDLDEIQMFLQEIKRTWQKKQSRLSDSCEEG